MTLPLLVSVTAGHRTIRFLLVLVNEFVREEVSNFAAGYDGGEDNVELGGVIVEHLPHLRVTH
jgi:hypothetical protein